MGGTNDKSNIVRLTPKEHFIVHLLLVKITQERDHYRMKAAVGRFRKSSYMNSRRFSIVRKNVSEAARFFHSGIPKSPEHRAKISEAALNMDPVKRLNQINSTKIKSAVTKAKMKASALTRNPEHNRRIGEAHKGVAKTEEHRSKISASLKAIPKVKCHCGAVGSAGNMKRWHLSNCKLIQLQ